MGARHNRHRAGGWGTLRSCDPALLRESQGSSQIPLLGSFERSVECCRAETGAVQRTRLTGRSKRELTTDRASDPRGAMRVWPSVA